MQLSIKVGNNLLIDLNIIFSVLMEDTALAKRTYSLKVKIFQIKKRKLKCYHAPEHQIYLQGGLKLPKGVAKGAAKIISSQS